RRTLVEHVDDAVKKASLQLANKTPRRSFIGRITSGIIVLGSSSLILKPQKALATACTPTECWGTVDVNVCYTPWKVVAAEPGQSGLVLRKGPSFSDDPVTYASNGAAIVIPVGG